MKRQLLLLSLGFATITMSNKATAAPSLIHYWHFNTIDTGGVHVNNLAADYSTLGGAKIVNMAVPGAGADTGYVDSFEPGDTTVNVRMSADPVGGQHHGMRLRNPNDSMECRWYIPSTNYKNIVLKFATQKSNNGPGTQNYDYSVDSGSTWRTTGLSATSHQPGANTWELVSLTLSSVTDTMIKNNPKLVFRIKLGTPNTGSSGNNRFDNITVEGDTIDPTGVNELIAASAQYSLYPNPAGNTITISAQTQDSRTITIYDIVGQQVYTTKTDLESTTVDIAALKTGIYYVLIMDSKGNLKKLDFTRK